MVEIGEQEEQKILKLLAHIEVEKKNIKVYRRARKTFFSVPKYPIFPFIYWQNVPARGSQKASQKNWTFFVLHMDVFCTPYPHILHNEQKFFSWSGGFAKPSETVK